jgi:hypothetical protein
MEMMSAPVFADRIDESIGAELSPLGFVRIRPRRWVAARRPLIRTIFEFQALKGATYSARWGFSLDFVPLWRADGFKWKRTAKTANFDLCIDPIDEYRGPPDWCSCSRPIWPGEAVNIARIAVAVKESTRVAKLDLRRVTSISDVVALFQERAAMRFQRFSLENYTQTDLAWGLSLIAIGEAPEGKRHLELLRPLFDWSKRPNASSGGIGGRECRSQQIICRGKHGEQYEPDRQAPADQLLLDRQQRLGAGTAQLLA